MPRFEGEIFFTMTVKARVFVESEVEEESEDFDETSLCDELLDQGTQVAEKIEELVDDNLRQLVQNMDGVLSLSIRDNEDGETTSWEEKGSPNE